MNTDLLREVLMPFVKHNKLIVALASTGLILIIYSLISLLPSFHTPEPLVFESASQSQSEQLEKTIVIDVEGAVVKPGVYTLKAESRIHDALIAASGLSEDADRDWVAKTLNLAAKLTDGAKIYIPFKGEQAAAGTADVAGVSVGGGININTASLSQLDQLSGIGAVTAQKIIQGRPYSSIEELATKKIVGAKVFEQIKDKISIY